MYKLKSKIKYLSASIIFLLLGLLFPKTSWAATLSLSPYNQAVNLNVSFTVDINLDTKGEKTTATDILLGFDPVYLEISQVDFGTSPLYPVNTKVIDNTYGQLRITGTQEDAVSFYQGSGTMATLTITPRLKGSASLVFSCEGTKTNDSNIFKQGSNQDIIECGNLVNATYAIGTSTTTATTATPTPRPTIPTSGNTEPTNTLIIGGVTLLGIGALIILLL